MVWLPPPAPDLFPSVTETAELRSPVPPFFLQFFEGFAIGSAVVDSGLGLMKSVLAGAIYSITTPLGIAVGELDEWASRGALQNEGCRLGCAKPGVGKLLCLAQPPHSHMRAYRAPTPPHLTTTPFQALRCARASTRTRRRRCWWRASSTPSPRVRCCWRGRGRGRDGWAGSCCAA